MIQRKSKKWLLFGGGAALVVAWYWFRPELLFIDRVVNDAFPRPTTVETQSTTGRPANDGSIVVAKGRFHSVAHGTSGQAAIHRLADGSRILRLTDFETSNGPDVRVYLVAADDAMDSATVTGSDVIELGQMKGNKGDQNYDLPADADLSRYRAVTIWCQRFSVNFGTAALRASS